MLARGAGAAPAHEALKPWFEEVFDEDYLRTLPFMTARPDPARGRVHHGALRLPAGAEMLDVGCGYGRHAIELGQRGFDVTGLDLSLPLLIRAADEAQRRALSVNFVHADMREMAFDSQFDGAYCLLTSFGYFDEETNLQGGERDLPRAQAGRRASCSTSSTATTSSLICRRASGGRGTGCVVLEEVDFNFHTSRIVTRRSDRVPGRAPGGAGDLGPRLQPARDWASCCVRPGSACSTSQGGLATRGQLLRQPPRATF